jgi:endonuclease/exonuclease/phosphatase family metal-dependent hydrolase
VAGALIVTAELSPADFAWLDKLRREHYPAERNRVAAHLTMFHALPPSAEREVRTSLARLAAEPPPRASIEGEMNLGGGVALRVVSTDLDLIRRELAEDFHGLLCAQDSGGWRPHVTIQNKVSVKQAHALLEQLEEQLRPGPLAIGGLGLYRYLGGSWEAVATFAFRGR